ncbi:MAG: hypothetical protein AAFP84_02140 [Actinomycetota bacterium]
MSDDLNELRAEMARLRARVDAYEAADTDKPVGRRNMLRALGAASAGAAVGGLALARPVSAADGDDLNVGQTNESSSPTILELGGTGSYSASEFVGGLHVTNDLSQTNFGTVGSCITALANSSTTGGFTTAFMGSGSSFGAKLDAPVPLKLSDSTNSGPPTSASGTRGQFKVDGGDLYYCVKSAPSAVWRLLAKEEDDPAPTTPIQFTPISPYRAYDSQLDGGAIAADGSRVVSVKDAIDPGTGAVTTPDAIPASATAISCNLTAVATTAPGFLAITPGDAASATTSTVNYVSAIFAVANAAITGLSGDREVKVFIGGTAGHTSQFIIDVNGFWS